LSASTTSERQLRVTTLRGVSDKSRLLWQSIRRRNTAPRLLLDVARLREVLASLDDSVLYKEDLTIDTSRHSPDDAAFVIKAHLEHWDRGVGG
jgi:hypothetical protein